VAALNNKKLSIIVGAFILFVLLYIAINQATLKSEKQSVAIVQSEFIEIIRDSALASLPKIDRELYTSLQNRIEKLKPEGKLILADSLRAFWAYRKKPHLEAFEVEKKAGITGKFEDWKLSGDGYFFAARYMPDAIKPELYKRAIKVYERADSLSTQFDTELKNNLAVCYVESSSNPMKGIGLLREVLSVDSNNIQAILNLGYFSIKSGQTDKAIERFLRVTEIDPNYADAYVYLGDVYESLNDIKNAIKYYEIYQSKVDDTHIKEDISNYIKNLKLKIN
jgi:tetratricopeptide (TPR) repeat protein